MPESARYYMACGNVKDADKMLEMVARDNGKPMLTGELASVDTEVGLSRATSEKIE